VCSSDLDIDKNPVIIGHEFCGTILDVGAKWRSKFAVGSKFSIQPALNYKGSLAAPGYSFRCIGGDATTIIIPNEVMECDCLLPYDGEGYFLASLSEPMSCIVGAFHACYHADPGTYVHKMGIVEGGATAMLAGAGPMGVGAIDYALHCDRKPGLLVVTDIDEHRLERAEAIYSVAEAARCGVKLHYVNTAKSADPLGSLLALTGNKGYNDVFVFAPVKQLVEQADKMLGRDGCLNFFAGPFNAAFSAELNFYNVHYTSTHVVGTSGGNTDDMRESLALMARGKIRPALMVTHIGGLNSVVDTTMNLPKIPGGKKLIYTNIKLDLTAIDDFAEKAKSDELFLHLAEITARHNGVWSIEAETFLLDHAPGL
jgi:threonine dehydrogenase-like Zn-dependent dehydrogenase